MTDINFTETKAERARRRQQKRGISHQESIGAITLHEKQRLADEAFARSLGLDLTYGDTRTQNARMYR